MTGHYCKPCFGAIHQYGHDQHRPSIALRPHEERKCEVVLAYQCRTDLGARRKQIGQCAHQLSNKCSMEKGRECGAIVHDTAPNSPHFFPALLAVLYIHSFPRPLSSTETDSSYSNAISVTIRDSDGVVGINVVDGPFARWNANRAASVSRDRSCEYEGVYRRGVWLTLVHDQRK